MADLVPKNDEITMRDSDILNPDFSFDDKVNVAANVATSLKKVIDTQKLAVPIQSKRGTKMYVTAEGWEVLGTMLGCTPYVEDVVEIEAKGKSSNYFAYKATVSIKHGETVLSRAIAIAERNKMQNERFAVYSMAQTRALGKAYRMALSWIIKMAGYEPTPAEEMSNDMLQFVEAEVVEKESEEVDVFTTASDLPKVDQFVREIIAHLLEIDKPVTKGNILKCSFQKMNDEEISRKEHKEVVSWCKAHCPEDLEEIVESLGN